MSERISLRCRSCNGHTIFVGKGGHLTCSYIDCKEPSIERQIAQLEEDNKDVRKSNHTLYLRCQLLEAENERLNKGIDMAHLHLLASICECGEPLKESDAFDCLDALKEGE